MFETEVEEILNKHCNCAFVSECIDGTRIRCSDFEEKKKLLLEGIEFGYNKANEWHYVKNGDYPKEYKDLWICFITEDDMKDYVRGWYEYDFDEDKHIFKTVNEITWNLENIYAWKEIVFPAMEEEINDLP